MADDAALVSFCRARDAARDAERATRDARAQSFERDARDRSPRLSLSLSPEEEEEKRARTR